MPHPVSHRNPGEVVVADVRPHWWFLATAVSAVVVVLAGAVAAVLTGAPRPADLAVAVLLVLVLVWLVGRYARWSGTHLVVTTDRLIHRQGFLARRGREIPLEHLADVGFRQSIWQRLLGAGDLVLESAGRDSREVFPWLPHPAALQEEIYRQVDAARRARGPSLADELERLDDLRRRGVLSAGEFEAQKSRLLGR